MCSNGLARRAAVALVNGMLPTCVLTCRSSSLATCWISRWSRHSRRIGKMGRSSSRQCGMSGVTEASTFAPGRGMSRRATFGETRAVAWWSTISDRHPLLRALATFTNREDAEDFVRGDTFVLKGMG